MESLIDDNSQELENCYCDKPRDLSQVEVQCFRCFKWFHQKCIQTPIGRCLQFMTNYTFSCKFCNSSQELFQRRQTNFSQMCETALANLMNTNCDRMSFSKDKEIIPFIETNWEILTTMPRRIKQTWHNTVVKTMSKESDVFISDNRDPNDPHFALRNQDLTRIGPNYETIVKQGVGRPAENSGMGRGFGRGAKKRDINEMSGKKQKSELQIPKLPPNGFPSEYPFNKDGYRYVLAEPDPHSPCRQEFDESQELAGKPIPGWLCRKLMAERVALSLHDRAMQLKISEDRRCVTGEKGYCMVRANYGANRGNWFCEITVEDMPDQSAVRLGWAQELANLQAPLGYDKFGYSFRSRKGTKFTESRGFHYSDRGFTTGDVIGLLIELPQDTTLPQTYKDKPLVKFKSFLYFEEKDEIQKSLKNIKTLPKSRITFFRNGVSLGTAFQDIYSGTYYPSASLYKGATVSFNFGPDFKFAPKSEFKPISDLVFDQQIEQTLSDVLFLVENQSKLRLDIFYGN